MSDTINLQEPELLKLQNIQLQKRLNQSELERIALEERMWAAVVSSRIEDSIANYQIDISTGVCTKKLSNP
jgi:hypothetical protein